MSTPTTAGESVTSSADRPADPPEWMPGLFDEPDADGFPARHRPARPHQDIWIAHCGAFCFKADVQQSVVIDHCLPCVACELADAAESTP